MGKRENENDFRVLKRRVVFAVALMQSEKFERRFDLLGKHEEQK